MNDMCKYLLLKSDLNLLSLKIPEAFCADYKIIQVMDDQELESVLKKEYQENPALNVSTAMHTAVGKEKQMSVRRTVISLKQGDYYFVYKQSEILYIKAAGSYSEITFQNQRNVVVTFNLADIESKLSEELFVRVHKSFIINVDSITRFIGNMVFLGEYRFPIGRKYRKVLIMRLNLLGYSMTLFRKD